MSSEGEAGGAGIPGARESRWRRRRPAPPAARPLILFSMLSALAFTVTLSVVFVPRLLEPRADLPQFTLDVVPMPGGVTIRVTGATMPQPAATYRLEVYRDGELYANVSLPGGDAALGVAYADGNGNGLLDRGDAITLATEPGHTYLAFLYSTTFHARLGKAGPWES